MGFVGFVDFKERGAIILIRYRKYKTFLLIGTVIGSLLSTSSTGYADSLVTNQTKSTLQTAPALQTFEVSPSRISLSVGGTHKLSVHATYSDHTSKDVSKLATYTSADPAVATVNLGVITAVGLGKTNITVTYEGQQKQVTVTVKSLDYIMVKPNEVPLVVGESLHLIVSSFFSDGSNTPIPSEQVKFESDNPSVAQVENGTVKAITTGTATITVTYGEQTDSVEVDVDSKQLLFGTTSISESPENDGRIREKLDIYSHSGRFSEDMKGKVTINNLPAGLSYTVARVSDNHLVIWFTDKAINHSSANNVDDAFVKISRSGIEGASADTESYTFRIKFYDQAPSASTLNRMVGLACEEIVKFIKKKLVIDIGK